MTTRAGWGVALAVFVGSTLGCTARQPPWGLRTATENRVHLVDNRADRQLVYRDTGLSRPATLLLVHGLASSKATWMYVASQLTDEFRIVTVDLLGHGDASAPERFSYSPTAQARGLVELIVAQDLADLVLVGSSYGGAIVLETAYLLAQRGEGGRLAGMVLIGPAAFPFDPPEHYNLVESPLLRELALLVLGPDGLARRLLGEVYHRNERITAEMVREYGRVYRRDGTVAAAVTAAAELMASLIARVDPVARYHGLEQPVLLIWGEHDRTVPRQQVLPALRRALPHAELAFISDAAHVPHEELPRQTARVIRRFIAERMR